MFKLVIISILLFIGTACSSSSSDPVQAHQNQLQLSKECQQIKADIKKYQHKPVRLAASQAHYQQQCLPNNINAI